MTALDARHHQMTVSGRYGDQDFPIPNTSIINVYNALSAVALLGEFGLSKERNRPVYGTHLHCGEPLLGRETWEGAGWCSIWPRGKTPLPVPRPVPT